MQTDHQIPARKSDFERVNKKRELVDLRTFPSRVDYRVKIKENETRDKYLDLAWELKKR